MGDDPRALDAEHVIPAITVRSERIGYEDRRKFEDRQRHAMDVRAAIVGHRREADLIHLRITHGEIVYRVDLRTGRAIAEIPEELGRIRTGCVGELSLIHI